MILWQILTIDTVISYKYRTDFLISFLIPVLGPESVQSRTTPNRNGYCCWIIIFICINSADLTKRVKCEGGCKWKCIQCKKENRKKEGGVRRTESKTEKKRERKEGRGGKEKWEKEKGIYRESERDIQTETKGGREGKGERKENTKKKTDSIGKWGKQKNCDVVKFFFFVMMV